MEFPLYNFIDGPPRPGQMSYPFSLKIPEWLPASMMMAGHWEDRLIVKYELRAQFIPKHDDDWADRNARISSFIGF